jgi:hypothetical protein
MDWIEKVLHVSPDGGNGSLEVLIYLVLSAVALLAINRAFRVRARRRRK